MFTIREAGKTITIFNTYRDSAGVVKTPIDAPVWSTDKPEAVALEPSEDGLSCVVAFVSVTTDITVTSVLASANLTNSNVFETVAAELPIVSVESEVIEA